MVGRFRKDTQTEQHFAKTNQVRLKQGTNYSEILGALTSFAGVATDVSTKYMNDAVDKDSIKQATRAAQGELPTVDATTGGYRAAAKVGYSTFTNKQDLDVKKSLADNPNMTDDEYDTLMSNVQDQRKAYLKENFPYIEGDEEFDKGVAEDTINTAIQFSSQRKANQLKDVALKSEQSFMGAMAESGNLTKEEYSTKYTNLVKELKISSTKAYELLGNVASNSNSLNEINNIADLQVDVGGKSYRLGDVNPKIDGAASDLSQQIQKKQKAEREKQMRADALGIAARREDIISGYKEKRYSFGTARAMAKQLNLDVGGSGGISAQQFLSSIKAVDKEAEYKASIDEKAQVISASGNLEYVPEIKKGDVEPISQQVISNIYLDRMGQLSEEDRKDPSVQSHVYNASINEGITKIYKTNGMVIPSIKSKLDGFGSTNPDNMVIKDEKGNSTLTQEGQEMLQTFRNVPPSLVHEYVSGRPAKVLNETVRLIDAGVPPAEALTRANGVANNPPIVPTATRYKQVDDAMDNFRHTFNILGQTLNEGSAAVIGQSLLRSVEGTMFDPTGEVVDSLLKAHVENQTADLGDGIILNVGLGTVAKSMGLENLKATKAALLNFREDHKEYITKRLPSLSQGDYDSTSMQVVGNRVHFVDRGGLFIGQSFSLKNIGEEYTTDAADKALEKEGKDTDESEFFNSFDPTYNKL